MERKQVHSREVKEAALKRLSERGVTIEEIAEIVYRMQAPYCESLTLDHCIESVLAVLEKREIQHAILVGIELDQLAEKKGLSEPLQSLVEGDEGLFGCDETLALGSVFGYGSIAVTHLRPSGQTEDRSYRVVGHQEKRQGPHVFG